MFTSFLVGAASLCVVVGVVAVVAWTAWGEESDYPEKRRTSPPTSPTSEEQRPLLGRSRRNVSESSPEPWNPPGNSLVGISESDEKSSGELTEELNEAAVSNKIVPGSEELADEPRGWEIV